VATNAESVEQLLDLYRRGLTRTEVSNDTVGVGYATGEDLQERIAFFERRSAADVGRLRVGRVRLHFSSGLEP
jgi:hypothetical protein